MAHPGSVTLRLLAVRAGTGVPEAIAQRRFAHDRGRVRAAAPAMLTDAGDAIAHIDMLRHQGDALGAVASAPAGWRTLDEVTPRRMKEDPGRAGPGSVTSVLPTLRRAPTSRSPAATWARPWCWTCTPRS